MPISLCVIAKDEEDRIEACLESASFLADRVVVDSESTDRTVQVARAAGARVIERAWPGYVAQKNFAVQEARHDWVLCLDADERLSPELAVSIQAAFAAGEPACAGFAFKRCTRYLGRWLRHGGWYPDRKLRLYRRDRGAWVGGRLHERAEVQGAVTELAGDLLHEAFRDLSDHLRTIDRYTTLIAEQKRARPGRFLRARVALAGPLKFFKMYVLQRGFLDGWPGFVCAVMGSYYQLLKYAKLWELVSETAGAARFADAASASTAAVSAASTAAVSAASAAPDEAG